MTCHVVMSASHDCLPESEVRKANWVPDQDPALRLRDFSQPRQNNARITPVMGSVAADPEPKSVGKQAVAAICSGGMEGSTPCSSALFGRVKRGRPRVKQGGEDVLCDASRDRGAR